jgi:hypothetical protein
VILSGSFLAEHKQEIIELARNTEKLERDEHPLQRIMSIKEDGDTLVIMTTDIHLPRRIRHAIVDAYKGDLGTHLRPGRVLHQVAARLRNPYRGGVPSAGP